MKVYRISKMTKVIEEHEADRVSEKSVWIEGERCARKSRHDEWYDTFNEAKMALMDRVSKQSRFHQHQVDVLRDTTGKLFSYDIDRPSRTSIRGNRTWDLIG